MIVMLIMMPGCVQEWAEVDAAAGGHLGRDPSQA
jgi:hypothetical protein